MKNFDIIAHENGTHSLRDLRCGEAMHSRIGPTQEALDLYVNPSKLLERLQTSGEDLVLWDVGMGTGANVLTALDQIQGVQLQGRLVVHSFESDVSGIRKALECLELFPFLKGHTEKVHQLLTEKTIQCEHFSWTLHEGDFFDNFPNVPQAHVIFYDFYAPQVCPDLWTAENFLKIRAFLANENCEFYTYSASTLVRASLLRAGFFVGSGSGTSMKRESTVASTAMDRLENPLQVNEDWLAKLSRSGRIAASELEVIQREISLSRQFQARSISI